jgi:HAD superfamily phosphatase (TIGR01681 family)
MTISAVIFDLDGTVLDTAGIQSLRDARDWKGCVARANLTQLFPGIRETLSSLRRRNCKLALCTSSVSHYAHRLLAHHKIDFFDILIAYHDTARQKPEPDPIVAALKGLVVSANEVVGVGDHRYDAAALAAASVRAFGAGWSPTLDRSAGWTRILSRPGDLLTAIAGL